MTESLTAAISAARSALEGAPDSVAPLADLPDDELVAALSEASAVRRILDARISLYAGEVARRSAPSLAHSGLAQRRGHRTADELVRVATGSTQRDARDAVQAGVLLLGAEAADAAGQGGGSDADDSGLGVAAPELPEGMPPLPAWAYSLVEPVRHGALVTGHDGPDILSRSPELFFRTDAAGRIETRPMKGTQPRSDDPAEDARRRAFLSTDEKNRAENLMIVDLLRNDISRVCTPGSVRVPELFAVESYETVHQMTSLVTGRMRGGTGLSDILRALFPCGSITGAPKLRAMEILAELEPTPREIYCGSIGWAAPDGRAEFNVAIRTLMLEGTKAVLNVGGGVVYDSTAPSEYEEALWKARFARRLTPAFA